MLTKKQNVIVMLLIFIFTMLLAVSCSGDGQDDSENNSLRFLRSYGVTNYHENGRGYLTFIYFTPLSKSLSEQAPDIMIPESNIKITNATITKSKIISGYVFHYINLEYDLITQSDNLVITEIMLDGISYDVGSVLINVVKDDSSYVDDKFVCSSAAGSSIGPGLRDYHADIKNISDKDITLSSVDAQCYENAEVYCTVNTGDSGKIPLSKEVIIVKPGEIVTIWLEFDQCRFDYQYDTFYVSPLISCIIDGQKYVKQFETYSSGFFLSDKDMSAFIKQNLN